MLQFGHGDEAVERAAPRLLSSAGLRLQFGHGDEAVERAAAVAAVPVTALQFGHGDEAVERTTDAIVPAPFKNASIRPRR